MSKKAILSALLVSSALLGTTAAANAATSSLQDESKLVTVEKDGAKVYKNSKLQESKKAKKGTVYKVDGYRDINNKKYYRVYQQDSKNKTVYRGYLLDKDTKDLKAKKVAKKDRFVGLAENDQTAWKNLYFNCKIKNYNGKEHSSNFEAKRTYEINGKKYFSLYRNNEWMGYMDASAFKVLKPVAVEEGKQAYKVVKEWNTYNDLFFTDKGTLKEGEKVTVKRIYTFETGRKYGSLYNAEGKWIGYANMNALEEDKAVDAETQKAIDEANDAIKKAEEILGKAQASKESKEAAQKVIDAAKETVKNGNLEDIKKVPAQISDAIKALKPGATTIDIQRVQEAIEEGKKALETAEGNGVGNQDKAKIDALKDAIANAEKVVADMKKGDASTEDADKAIKAIEDAINELGAPATSISLEELRNTIREAEHLYKSTENTPVTGREELGKEIKAAKDLLAEATKDGKVTNKQITDEIEKLTDAMANVKFDRQDLDKQVEAVKALAKDVYMTAEGQKKLEDAIKKIENNKAMKYDEYLSAKSMLADAKAGLEKQPNKADGEALNKAIKQVESLAKLPNKGEDLYGVPALKEAYEKATHLMTEMKKDTAKENTATEKISKAEVQKATQDLNLAFENLGLNETQLQEFIDAAKKLAANDSDFKNDKDFQAAVDALEAAAKDAHFANYDKIQAAAKKVYDMMVKDLQAVYNGVLPWNNNQETVNPAVKPVEVKTTKADPAAATAVAGQTLTGEQFGQAVLKAAPKVGDYYTTESYKAFTNAMTEAQTIIKDAQAKDVKVDANAAEKVNVAMKDLAEAQANLRFDRQKMIDLTVSGKKARQTWVEEQTKVVAAQKDAKQDAIKAQSKAANKGLVALAAKLGYSLKDEANQYGDGSEGQFFASEKDVNELLKATKANAETLTQLLYAAENDYYTYISTVKWDNGQQKFVKVEAEKGE